MAENILFNPMANDVIIDKVSYVVQVQSPSTFIDCETIPQLARKILQCLYATKQIVYRDAITALDDIISPRRESAADIDKLDVKLRMERFLEKMLAEVKELKSQGISFEEDPCPSYESTTRPNTLSPNLEHVQNMEEDAPTVTFNLDTTELEDSLNSAVTIGQIDADRSRMVPARLSTPTMDMNDDQLPSYDEVMTGNKFKTVSYF